MFIFNYIRHRNIRFLKLVCANRTLYPKWIQNISPTIAVSHREEKRIALYFHSSYTLNSMWNKLRFLLFIRLISSWCIAVPSSKQKDYPVLQDILMGSNSSERSASMKRAEHYNCTFLPHVAREWRPRCPNATLLLVLPEYIILILILEMQCFSCWPD